MFEGEVEASVVHCASVGLLGMGTAERGSIVTGNAFEEVAGVLIEDVDFGTELTVKDVEVKTDVISLGNAPLEITLQISVGVIVFVDSIAENDAVGGGVESGIEKIGSDIVLT